MFNFHVTKWNENANIHTATLQHTRCINVACNICMGLRNCEAILTMWHAIFARA